MRCLAAGFAAEAHERATRRDPSTTATAIRPPRETGRGSTRPEALTSVNTLKARCSFPMAPAWKCAMGFFLFSSFIFLACGSLFSLFEKDEQLLLVNATR